MERSRDYYIYGTSESFSDHPGYGYSTSSREYVEWEHKHGFTHNPTAFE